VIGASAGGVDALQSLISFLPSDLPAAIFAVVHIAPWAHSELPHILNHNGHIPAEHPRSGELITAGRIYIAPPDYHMILQKDSVQLWRGPKENRHRPAVNPLFRSAAVNFKKRVVGVILSGSLDDGAAGLWWVKDFGGVAIVQDPQEATFPDMPQSAIEHVSVDYVLPLEKIATLLKELTTERSKPLRKAKRK
jgi:two-component system chemotaxis response regulator CheB